MSADEVRRHEIKPRWVLVDSILHDVSDYCNLTPNKRPLATCPLCNERVVLKLGNKYVHHYSHKTDVVCSAHDVETAEHLNTKFYIYKELLRGKELIISRKCISKCGKINEQIWAKNWTNIKVEYSINSIRPDITIFKDSELIAAIEIRMWHAVGLEKQKNYESMELPWLEVRAGKGIYEGETKWDISKPLPFEKIFPDTNWECKSCKDYNSQQGKLFDFSGLRKELDNIRDVTKKPLNSREGICIYCGNLTSDWWYLDGSSDKCKCRSCLNKGVS